jgi:hypothetical protein
MATPAEAHEVLLIVCPAFRERNDVVHLFNRNKASFFLTELTERMFLYVPVTDLLPVISVPSVS